MSEQRPGPMDEDAAGQRAAPDGPVAGRMRPPASEAGPGGDWGNRPGSDWPGGDWPGGDWPGGDWPAAGPSLAGRSPALRYERIALVDLLDRLLAGGVVISGDIRLSIADVDLVNVSLRALISSVSSVLEQGYTGEGAGS